MGQDENASAQTGDIAKDVEDALGAAPGDTGEEGKRVLAELETLSAFIHQVKAEIAALRPDSVKDDYLQTAGDELEAIVEATEKATNEIMDAAESMDGVMGALDGEQAQVLMDATTRIFEACGFQDITGQRINKVCGALNEIESKIDSLLVAFGHEVPATPAPKDDKKPSGPLTDEDLLEGPQMEGQASTQDEVDALLKGFD